jgi:hypothetical protein
VAAARGRAAGAAAGDALRAPRHRRTPVRRALPTVSSGRVVTAATARAPCASGAMRSAPCRRSRAHVANSAAWHGATKRERPRGMRAGSVALVTSDGETRLQTRRFCVRAPQDLRLSWPVILLRGLPASLRRFQADSRAGSARDERSWRSFAPEAATEDADLQGLYGSDGTRTRDLRRDRSPGRPAVHSSASRFPHG